VPIPPLIGSEGNERRLALFQVQRLKEPSTACSIVAAAPHRYSPALMNTATGETAAAVNQRMPAEFPVLLATPNRTGFDRLRRRLILLLRLSAV
jgi:hypothetical protein